MKSIRIIIAFTAFLLYLNYGFTSGSQNTYSIEHKKSSKSDTQNGHNLKQNYQVTFNVNMTDAAGFDPDQHNVYLTGSFTGWAEPGTSGSIQMSLVQKSEGNIIYTVTAELPAGHNEYKYFSNAFGAGWAGGEWPGDPNRVINVAENMTVNNIWGIIGDVEGYTVTFEISDQQGNPVTDASVTLGNIDNEPGNYLFEDVIPGTYNFSVAKEGYITHYDQLEVTDHDLHIEVTLIEGDDAMHSIRFCVNMTDAVAEGDVVFDPDIHDVYITGTFTGWTMPGADASYSLETAGSAQNQYCLQLNIEGGMHEYKYFLVEDEASWGIGEWAGDPNRNLDATHEKTVFNLFGTPIIFTAEFEIMNEQDDMLPTAVIDINGFTHKPGLHVFNHVAEGIYDFTVAHAGYADYHGQFEITDHNIIIPVTMIAEEILVYTISFVVEDNHGDPLHNAIITLNGETNDPGNYVFENLPSGNYDYLVQKEGYHDAEGIVSLVDEDVTEHVVMIPDEITVQPPPATAITVFPNPAGSIISIISEKNLIQSIRIIDALGNTAYHLDRIQKNNLQINASSFKRGLYIITIKTDLDIVTKKLLLVE